MSIRVLYFARSRELTRTSGEDVRLEDVRAHAQRQVTTAEDASAAVATAGAVVAPVPVLLSQLLPYLLSVHTDLVHLPLGSLLLAHNHEMVAPDDATIALKEGDEVALIQPISGG